jgi:phospholipase C
VKTILLRFCPESLTVGSTEGSTTHILGLGRPRAPGTRVAQANDLGELLTRVTPRPAPSRDGLVKQAAVRAPLASSKKAGDDLEHPLTDLQKRILAATHELARLGHPANTP